MAMAQFHKPLIKEIGFSRGVLSQSGYSSPLSSVFFGGGTPSLFSPIQIASILDALKMNFGFDDACEITLEANPESATEEFLEGIRAAGVNRLSIGSQSFDSDVLRILDRQHEIEKVSEVVRKAKELGFRTSIDLIYGAPGESLESWKRTVEKALELKTEHISAYSLIVEEGTKLARQIKRGELDDVDEDLNAEKYEYATQRFEEAGLEWYEVSNFGEASAHNIAYWQSQNWWGYGPGAHSHIAGNRFWNHKHPAKYVELNEIGSPAAGIEELTQRQMLEEQLMLGLRTKFGVSRELPGLLGVEAAKVARQISLGTLNLEGDRLVPTKTGRLLVDRLVVEFLQ